MSVEPHSQPRPPRSRLLAAGTPGAAGWAQAPRPRSRARRGSGVIGERDAPDPGPQNGGVGPGWAPRWNARASDREAPAQYGGRRLTSRSRGAGRTAPSSPRFTHDRVHAGVLEGISCVADLAPEIGVQVPFHICPCQRRAAEEYGPAFMIPCCSSPAVVLHDDGRLTSRPDMPMTSAVVPSRVQDRLPLAV